ncbi:MAG TPA: DUF3261 domain-containing protein [Thermoanaerobaculia bacterium]|nr:DUF3261 domain-containing protein [Thermoanaerobaculia bacterium]
MLACRTAHVSGPAVAPLPLTEAPLEALFARADAFPGARSIMKVRATTGGETRSFRAQLIVENRQHMELIAYTPVGTTAATIRAEGEQVTVTDSRTGSTTAGNASDLLRQYGFFIGGLTPAEMGILLLGYPPRRDLTYEATATGLSRATVADVVVTFDPPSLPAQHVVVLHGADRVDIDHLEVAAMK